MKRSLRNAIRGHQHMQQRAGQDKREKGNARIKRLCLHSMGDTEILSYYNLTTLSPTEWPVGKDEDYVSEDDLALPDGQLRPKYVSLERGPSLRESVPGSQRGKDGVQNLVQKDEPDPLGTGSSVMQLLHRQGLRANDDPRLRE